MHMRIAMKLNGSECTDLKFLRANYGNSFLKHFQLKQFVNTKLTVTKQIKLSTIDYTVLD